MPLPPHRRLPQPGIVLSKMEDHDVIFAWQCQLVWSVVFAVANVPESEPDSFCTVEKPIQFVWTERFGKLIVPAQVV